MREKEPKRKKKVNKNNGWLNKSSGKKRIGLYNLIKCQGNNFYSSYLYFRFKLHASKSFLI